MATTVYRNNVSLTVSQPETSMNGFVLGGVSSGVGKTVATLAIIRALDDPG